MVTIGEKIMLIQKETIFVDMSHQKIWLMTHLHVRQKQSDFAAGSEAK